MSSVRLDRRTVSKTKPDALLRLARFIGIPITDKCVCDSCVTKLVEAVVRKLDVEDSWPPRRLERNW